MRCVPFVGERYGQHIERAPVQHVAVLSAFYLINVDPMNGRSGLMDQQLSNVSTAAFADADQLLLTSNGLLFRNQSEPSRSDSPRRSASDAHGCSKRRRRECADRHDLHQPSADLALACGRENG